MSHRQKQPNSKVDELIQKEKNKKQLQLQLVEKLKICINEMGKTENGVFFLKWLYSECTMVNFEESIRFNTDALLYFRGKADIYNNVQALMDEQTRINVEIKEQ